MKSRWQRSSKQVGIDSDGKGGVSGCRGGLGWGGQLSARINRLSYVFIRKFISSVHMCRRLNTMESGEGRDESCTTVKYYELGSHVSISIQFMTASKNIGRWTVTLDRIYTCTYTIVFQDCFWFLCIYVSNVRVRNANNESVRLLRAGRVGRSPLFRNNDRSASYARYEYWRVNAMKGKYLESPVTRVDSIVVDVQRQSTRPIRCPIRWPMFCRLLRHVDLQRSLNIMYHELVYPFPFFSNSLFFSGW